MSDDASELRENFEHFDADDNGEIDREEFAGLMEALGAGMSEAELDMGFETIDTDGSGTIEFDEFESWWRDR